MADLNVKSLEELLPSKEVLVAYNKAKKDYEKNANTAAWFSIPKNIVGLFEQAATPDKTLLQALFASLLCKWPELTDALKQIAFDRFSKDETIKILQDTLLFFKQSVNDLGAALTESMKSTIAQIDESIEKHDNLNPKLWNNDNTLRPEVAEKIKLIVYEFLKGLAEDGIKFKLKDVILLGSNCSYNYTDQSDLDIHLVADVSTLQCPDNLYPLLYSAYRSIFNKNHDISFYGIPVEIFVETDDAKHISNGVFSVLNNKWLKKPVQEDIPEIDYTVFNTAFEPWEVRYNDVIKAIGE